MPPFINQALFLDEHKSVYFFHFLSVKFNWTIAKHIGYLLTQIIVPKLSYMAVEVYIKLLFYVTIFKLDRKSGTIFVVCLKVKCCYEYIFR